MAMYAFNLDNVHLTGKRFRLLVERFRHFRIQFQEKRKKMS